MEGLSTGHQDAWKNAALRKELARAGFLEIAFSQSKDTLQHLAAKRAFKGMTVYYLRKFFNYLAVPYARGQKPTSEAQLVAAIARHLLPNDYPEEKIQESIELWGAVPLPGVNTAVHDGPQSEMDLVLEEIGDEDLEEVLQKERERVAAKARRAAKAKEAAERERMENEQMPASSSRSRVVEAKPKSRTLYALAW